MSKDLLTKLLAGMAAALVAGVSHSGPIATRAELAGLLGGVGNLETFEKFPVPATDAVTLTCAVLNNAANCNGQSGLVVPGLDIRWGLASGQWNGAGRGGAPSKEILSGAPGSPPGEPLEIDFTQPVQAFGVDLRAFVNFGAKAQLKIFDADDKLINVDIQMDLPADGTPVFLGWENAGGIGRIELKQIGQAWSPVIDNLQFGTFSTVVPVPEPSALSLVALGLAGLFARRLTLRARS